MQSQKSQMKSWVSEQGTGKHSFLHSLFPEISKYQQTDETDNGWSWKPKS